MIRPIKLAATFLLAATMVPSAMADPSSLCPSGWSCEKDRRGTGYNFTAPGGDEKGEAEVNLFPKDSAADIQKLLEMKFRHIEPYGSELIGSPQTADKGGAKILLALRQDEYNSRLKYITGAMAQKHALGGTVTCAIAMPMRGNAPPQKFTDFMSACEAFIKTGAPFNEAQREKAAKREQVANLSTMTGHPGQVAHYVFGLRYVSGVGGMVLPEYYPVILFEDGIAVKDITFAPNSVDVQALRRASPDTVGTWKQSGGSFYIDWPDAREPLEVEKSRDKPRVFRKGHRLNGKWTSISGGGDTALGGSTSIAVTNSFQFFPDGSFDAGRSMGATASGSSGWSKSGASGTYEIDGASLELSFRDGNKVRTSLFYDTSKDGSYVIWIGGDGFTD